MKRHAHPVLSSRLAFNRSLCERVMADALTEEDRARAVLDQYSPVKKPEQCAIVLTVPSNAGVATGGQPEPSGLTDHGSLGQ